MVLGNEAPGVMKRTAVFMKPHQLTTGLTHADQNFGFREWLKPEEPWESTWVFTTIYENTDDFRQLCLMAPFTIMFAATWAPGLLSLLISQLLIIIPVKCSFITLMKK